jgi:hypothetical protein
MTSQQELPSKINDWLEKEGYPLEMRVAYSIRKHSNLSVGQGWFYEDAESGRSREIDVICTASDPMQTAEINFVFECKATKKPWVLFSSETAASGRHRLHSFGIISGDSFRAIYDQTFGLDRDVYIEECKKIPWLWKDDMMGYSIAQAFDGNKDVPYNGTLSAFKAALWLKDNSLWIDPKHRKFAISFPVVVTSSPLYECSLDKGGNQNLRQIDHGFLFFKQFINTSHSVCVSIVTEDYLESFIKECSEVSNKMLTVMSPAIEEYWKEFQEKAELRKLRNEKVKLR